MRRIATAAGVLLAGALLVAGTAAGGEGGSYQVRAIFDSGAFLTRGEEVRVAGARVGEISDLELTVEGEPAHEDGRPEPGKAAVVMRIDDPAMHDFRADASCLIRPQSLLGERYIECEPTRPGTSGESAAPLEQIPDGRPGAGQRLLPLEANGKAVDVDLVTNALREPYSDRLRLILNELGAGLAARGDELAEIVERANPALRETNQVVATLARQRRQVETLARDADAVLGGLARGRDGLAGFINGAQGAAAAASERDAELERGLARLPRTLRETRVTMTALERLAEEGTPTVSALGAAAPALSRATRALAPFSRAADPALVALGDAAAESGGPLADSDPVLRDVRGLARSAASPADDLWGFLRTLEEGGGYETALRAVFRAAGTFNGFDSLGHFARTYLVATNCNDYATQPESSCGSNFGGAAASGATAGSAGKGLGRTSRLLDFLLDDSRPRRGAEGP